jgi:large subunit ribosomal protein L35
MPKIKSSRMARKKYRVGGTGVIKKAQAGASHNTGKKSAKRIRRLKLRNTLHKTNDAAARRLVLA